MLDGAHRLFAADACEIAHRDRRLRPSPHGQGVHPQFARFQALSHERRVALHVLEKALARSLDRDVRGRFGHGARGRLALSRDGGVRPALPEEDGIAREHFVRKGGKRLPRTQFGRAERGEHALLFLLRHGALQGRDDLLGEQVLVRQHVGKDADEGRPRGVVQVAEKDVLGGQERFEGGAVRRKISRKQLLFHITASMRKRQKGMRAALPP